MSHLEEVSARVDAAIAESVIAHMNELLIALSDDAELRLCAAAAFAHGYRASRQTISRRSGRAPRAAHQRRHDPVTH